MHYLIGKTKSVAILLFALVVVVTQQPSFAEDKNSSTCFTKESLLEIQKASDDCGYEYDIGETFYLVKQPANNPIPRPEGRSIRLFIFNGTDPCDLCNYHEFGAKQIPVTELKERGASTVLYSELTWAITVDGTITAGEWDDIWVFGQGRKGNPPAMHEFEILLEHIQQYECRDMSLCR